MTPKEKAKELFDKYCLALKTEGNDFVYWANVIQAKQCVLIMIDEMLIFHKDFFYISEGSLTWQYFQNVKKEIEKL